MNVFVMRRKAVTSEALLLRRGKRVSREKRNVFSLDLNRVTESLLTIVYGSEFQVRFLCLSVSPGSAETLCRRGGKIN